MQLILYFPSRLPAKAYHGWAQRADEEHQASLPGGPPLLLSDYWQTLLRAGLRQRWRGKLKLMPRFESSQNLTVCPEDADRRLCVLPAVLPSPEGEDLPWAPGQVLRRRNRKCTWISTLPAHCIQVRNSPTAPPIGQMRAWWIKHISLEASLSVLLSCSLQRPEAREHSVRFTRPHRTDRLWPLQRRSWAQWHHNNLLRDTRGTKLTTGLFFTPSIDPALTA